MSLYEQQVEKHQEIARIKTNFKKDSASRKSVDYHKTRLVSLDDLWEGFKCSHDRMCTEESRTHQYFTEKWYEKTEKLYSEVRSLLWQSYQDVLEPLLEANEGVIDSKCIYNTPREDVQQQEQDIRASGSADGGIPRAQQMTSTGTNSKYYDLQRQQQVNFKALYKTMEGIVVEDIEEKWEFEDALKSLQSRWETIDKLHWEIDAFSVANTNYDELFDKSEKRYIELKRSLNKKMWTTSHREKSTPKIDIPTFSGNYNQWLTFKDLFYEAIHNNPSMSKAQKMQFLKGKLRGEAERLIQHLPISTSNYGIS